MFCTFESSIWNCSFSCLNRLLSLLQSNDFYSNFTRIKWAKSFRSYSVLSIQRILAFEMRHDDTAMAAFHFMVFAAIVFYNFSISSRGSPVTCVIMSKESPISFIFLAFSKFFFFSPSASPSSLPSFFAKSIVLK